MCGRYYIDDETAREIEKLVHNLDRRLQSSCKKDIYPAQNALVLRGDNHDEIFAEQMIWGFPKYDNKGIIINARSESAMEKGTFKESVLHRRCVIPTKGFYEWNKSKEKFSFERTDSDSLFMAGCFDIFDGQDRFVILTTKANSSVRKVHDRMPLILEKGEIATWLYERDMVQNLLHKTSTMLTYETEYEQMNLF